MYNWKTSMAINKYIVIAALNWHISSGLFECDFGGKISDLLTHHQLP